jgi:aspartate/methionine/tyrosine aminotransferase
MLVTDPALLGASESIAITARASAMRTEGHNPVILSIGDTHFPPPQPICEAMQKALQTGKTHYTATQGLPELRQLLARYFFNQTYDPADFLVVPGLKQGLFYLFEGIPEACIAAIEPAWLGYKYTALMAGKKYLAVNRTERNWLHSLEQLNFNVLVICSPNNPDGYVYSPAEIEALINFARSKRAWLVIDGIYDLYQYGKSPQDISIASRYERTVLCNGFSKSHAMTGLRLGFIATKDRELLHRCLRIQEHLATCPGSIAQYGALAFPESQGIIQEYLEYYRENLRMVIETLPALEEFSPMGAFYFFIDVRKFGKENGQEFAKDLLELKRVAVIPGAAYGDGFNGYIRLSFSVARDQLLEGISRIRDLTVLPHGK